MYDPQGFQLEGVAFVAFLRTVGHRGQDVHVGLEIDVIPRFGGGLFDAVRAVCLDGAVHEYIHVVRNVFPTEAPGLEGRGEAVQVDGVFRRQPFLQALKVEGEKVSHL